MNNCYTFQEIKYEINHKNVEPFFLSDLLSVTYILHLVGNNRLENAIKQINEFKPTQRVFVVHNRGYKKCAKKNVLNTTDDIIDAYIQIFKHSDLNKFTNILVLEDDFIFSNLFKDKQVSTELNSFLINKPNKSYAYFLGTLPLIQVPYFSHHRKVLLSVGAHATIYSQNLVQDILSKQKNSNAKKIGDWDFDLKKYTNYMYYKPLCYQLFTQTENQSFWAINYPILYQLVPIAKYIIKKLDLDTNVEPGYSYFYNFSYYIFLFVVFLIFYLVHVYFIKKN